MNILEDLNELGNKIGNKVLNTLNLNNLQEEFLKNNIGQIANTAIDIGLKAMLPDFIEEEVIEVKNALVSGGLKEGIDTAIQNAIELGKKALGIENSNFTSLLQAKNAVEIGDAVGGISDSIDNILEEETEKGFISNNISELIKNEKNLILNNISTNIEDEFFNEIKSLEKIEKYITNWEKFYEKKDLEGLTKEYNKIEKQMKKILPLENLINNVNKIRNINELIKNTDNFDFNKIYLDLAKSI